jgi:hypothetical protein
MSRGPLLVVFNCDETYFQCLGQFHAKPIISYKQYKHDGMLTHAANAMGYETIVPFWEFMNSYGKMGPTKGFGRVLAQNAVGLFGLTRIDVVWHFFYK